VALVEEGNYTVNFREIADWFTPASVAVSVTNGFQTRITGEYGRLILAGGFGTDAGEFKYPRGLAVHSNQLYVTDSGNHRVQVLDLTQLYEVGASGIVSVTTNAITNTAWTVYGGTASGSAAGQFKQPFGVAVDPSGGVWVADSGNYRIQYMATTGTPWVVYGSQGSDVGQLNLPYDVETDSTGGVYVADHHNSRIQKFELPGTWSEFVPNEEPIPSVRFPRGLALDTNDLVYVTDYDNALGVHRVRVFDTDGEPLYDVATAAPDYGELDEPTGLSFGPSGKLLVSSTGNGKIDEGDLSEPLVPVWEEKMPAGTLNRPHDVAADKYGNIFVADTENHRVMILLSDDADGDGSRNGEEIVAGTNPFDDDSMFDIQAERSLTADGWRVVTWSSLDGRYYTVSILTDMESQVWEDIAGYTQIPGTGGEMRYTNTTEMLGVEFYRVRVGIIE
jgi:sugar lactone lactonase YvrE